MYEKLITIKAKYYELGIMLGLRPSDLDAVRRGNDIDLAFTKILLMWLRQNYNVHEYGLPTWRNLVKAIDHSAGGNNHELAMKVAGEHSNTGKTPHFYLLFCHIDHTPFFNCYSHRSTIDQA